MLLYCPCAEYRFFLFLRPSPKTYQFATPDPSADNIRKVRIPVSVRRLSSRWVDNYMHDGQDEGQTPWHNLQWSQSQSWLDLVCLVGVHPDTTGSWLGDDDGLRLCSLRDGPLSLLCVGLMCRHFSIFPKFLFFCLFVSLCSGRT